MELQYIKVQQYDRVRKPCPYNEACFCDAYERRGCYRCGFNPTVAEKRIAKIMEKGCKA